MKDDNTRSSTVPATSDADKNWKGVHGLKSEHKYASPEKEAMLKPTRDKGNSK